jgi:hypothetical protein
VRKSERCNLYGALISAAGALFEPGSGTQEWQPMAGIEGRASFPSQFDPAGL